MIQYPGTHHHLLSGHPGRTSRQQHPRLQTSKKEPAMRITGIIAEYNPFHNGHAFQLAQAKTETDADYVVIIMSGNFVQRGAPALLDKFVRAKMALLEGADLVIELPALWSCASAEYFAGAGIALLSQLGCIDTLCYGCETPSAGVFSKICEILTDEPPLYRQLLTDRLRAGCGFARARADALLALLPESAVSDAAAVLKHPNNILALEYHKAAALESFQNHTTAIRMHPILRQGQGYHSSLLQDSMSSASAIRQFLAGHPPEPEYSRTLFHVMPDGARRLLLDYKACYPFLYENDCSQMLHYCLLKNAADGFSAYADCTPELSNRICHHLYDYTGFTDFCTHLKSKDLAYTRISRVLLHILLDIRQDSYTYWRSRSYVPYARILGFRKESQALLKHLKKHTSIPLLTRAAGAEKILRQPDAAAFFQNHLLTDAIYRALILEKGGRKIKNEYQQQLVVL